MVLRRIQRVEGVVDGIHVRSLISRVTHGAEDIHYLVDGLGNRMLDAERNISARFGDVDPFRLELGRSGFLLNFCRFLRKQLLELGFYLIGCLLYTSRCV